MSTGLFIGVRGSFAEAAAVNCREFLQLIGLGLKERGLPVYVDPEVAPDVYVNHLFGRSALDHHTSRVLVDIAMLADSRERSPQLALIRDNPYRVAFLPADFDPPLKTDYVERIDGHATPIFVGSLPRLLAELRLLAGVLKIPLEGTKLADRTASSINDWERFQEEDTTELIEDQRTAWLLLFEGTRLAILHNAALVLAG